MLSAELRKRRKQNLKDVIRGGYLPPGPAKWMNEWYNAYLENNKEEIARIIRQNKWAIMLASQFLPEPAKTTLKVVANAPEASIEFSIAVNKLLDYNPLSLFGL